MIGVRNKLKSFEIHIPDSFFINHTLNSLPPKFSQLRTVFNTQNESWTLDELISKCDAEENKLEREGLATVMLVSHPNQTLGLCIILLIRVKTLLSILEIFNLRMV